MNLDSLKKDIERIRAAIPESEPPERREVRLLLESDHRLWLTRLLPAHFRDVGDFAPHHNNYWHHVWNLTEARPPAFFAIWNRAGMKSTSAEATCPAIAALGHRSYGLYISGTQKQADTHVDSVSGMLTSSRVIEYYPELSRPKVEYVGDRRRPGAWNHASLRTAGGLSLDSFGLDSSVRGIRDQEKRPDFIIVDDIDNEKDSPLVIQKKIETLKSALLAAGAENCAVFLVQNLIHRDSVISQLLDGRADFLLDRKVSGPVPAIKNPSYRQEGKRWQIVSGEPTWQGMPLEACEGWLNSVGKRTWDTEFQHEMNLAYRGAVYPAWNEVFHIITRSEFERVYGNWGAKIETDGGLRLPARGYANMSMDLGTTLAHPCVVTWNWRPGEGMPHSDCLFFIGEMCRPRFPPTREQEVVSPLQVGKEIQDRERSWGLKVQWRQGSHEAAAVRNSFEMDLREIPGYSAMYVDPIKTEDGPVGITGIQDLLAIDEELRHPFRLYPEGHPQAGQPLRGRPQMYLVVEDGQGELFWDERDGALRVRPATDEEGFSRTRFEFPRYRYPENAQGAESTKPMKVDDDAMDTLKAAVARVKPSIQPLTREERIALELPAEYKPEALAELTGEARKGAEMAAYFAYHTTRARIEREYPQSSGLYEDIRRKYGAGKYRTGRNR